MNKSKMIPNKTPTNQSYEQMNKNKITTINTLLSLITSNTNGLNCPITRHRLVD